MAGTITLKSGGATKVVTTYPQAAELIALGWTQTALSGTPGTEAIGTESYLYESMTNPFNPTFRGIGFTGDKGTLAAVLRNSSVGLTLDEFKAITNAVGGKFDAVEATFTKFAVVAALPESNQVATTIYVLTVDNGTQGVGMWKYVSNAWAAYVPVSPLA